MAFPNKMNIELPLGVEGAIAKSQFLVTSPRFAEDGIKVGHFAFLGTDPEKQIKGAGETVLGLVVRNGLQLGTSLQNSIGVMDGDECAVMERGFAYVKCTTLSTYGQKVLVNKTNGTITTGEPDGTNLDTGFTVEQGAAANSVCMIKKI